jgi:soluble cytochrome b562
MNPYTAMAEILRKAQGHTSTETGEPIDVGYEVMTLRKEIDQCRRETASFESMLKERDAEIERLSHAINLAASQKLPDEMDAESREFADWQHGYKALVKLARVALAAGVKDSLTTQNGGAKADKP